MHDITAEGGIKMFEIVEEALHAASTCQCRNTQCFVNVWCITYRESVNLAQQQVFIGKWDNSWEMECLSTVETRLS